MKTLLGSLLREWRYVFRWYHAVLLAAVVGLSIPGVSESMGLTPRSLLVIGRAAAPLPLLLMVPQLILQDRTTGAMELVATARRNLFGVWLARFLLLLGWAAIAVSILVVPTGLRAPSRYGVGPDLIGSLADLLVMAAVSAHVAHWTGSEVTGTLGGILSWAGGVVLGTQPPGGMAWLRLTTPLSCYFFGGSTIFWLNRLLWGAGALLLIGWQRRLLDQPEGLLQRRA
ncbi:MAG: hypothetical protein ACM3XM_16810 [Mycobacterium leprae]